MHNVCRQTGRMSRGVLAPAGMQAVFPSRLFSPFITFLVPFLAAPGSMIQYNRKQSQTYPIAIGSADEAKTWKGLLPTADLWQEGKKECKKMGDGRTLR